MKKLLYAFITIGFILVTFFGLGPVMLADGSVRERIFTFIVVILLYILLGWITVKVNKRSKPDKK